MTWPAVGGSLEGRLALVTGGSGGIGRAIVRHLAAAGANVAVGYGHDADRAAAAVRTARERRVKAEAFPADLADPARVVGLAETVLAEMGPVDVFVNCAGIAPARPESDIDSSLSSLWEQTLAVNLTAPFLLAQRLIPPMAGRGFGRVLFVSSIAAFTGGLVGPHYAASKAGLHGLVPWFAGRYAGRGVTVNAIAPVLIAETGMVPVSVGASVSNPVGRPGTVDEVADLSLAMLRNGYVTGKVYLMDGGAHPR